MKKVWAVRVCLPTHKRSFVRLAALKRNNVQTLKVLQPAAKSFVWFVVTVGSEKEHWRTKNASGKNKPHVAGFSGAFFPYWFWEGTTKTLSACTNHRDPLLPLDPARIDTDWEADDAVWQPHVFKQCHHIKGSWTQSRWRIVLARWCSDINIRLDHRPCAHILKEVLALSQRIIGKVMGDLSESHSTSVILWKGHRSELHSQEVQRQGLAKMAILHHQSDDYANTSRQHPCAVTSAICCQPDHRRNVTPKSRQLAHWGCHSVRCSFFLLVSACQSQRTADAMWDFKCFICRPPSPANPSRSASKSSSGSSRHNTVSWDEPASKFIMAKHRLGHARFRPWLANSPPVWQKGEMRYQTVTCPAFFPKIDQRGQRGVEFVDTVIHIHTWQSFLEPLQSTAIASHMMSKKKTSMTNCVWLPGIVHDFSNWKTARIETLAPQKWFFVLPHASFKVKHWNCEEYSCSLLENRRSLSLLNDISALLKDASSFFHMCVLLQHKHCKAGEFSNGKKKRVRLGSQVLPFWRKQLFTQK